MRSAARNDFSFVMKGLIGECAITPAGGSLALDPRLEFDREGGFLGAGVVFLVGAVVAGLLMLVLLVCTGGLLGADFETFVGVLEVFVVVGVIVVVVVVEEEEIVVVLEIVLVEVGAGVTL